MQDKKPRNEKGKADGHWLNINSYGDLIFKGTFVNGVELGYWVESRFDRIYYAR